MSDAEQWEEHGAFRVRVSEAPVEGASFREPAAPDTTLELEWWRKLPDDPTRYLVTIMLTLAALAVPLSIYQFSDLEPMAIVGRLLMMELLIFLVGFFGMAMMAGMPAGKQRVQTQMRVRVDADEIEVVEGKRKRVFPREQVASVELRRLADGHRAVLCWRDGEELALHETADEDEAAWLVERLAGELRLA